MSEIFSDTPEREDEEAIPETDDILSPEDERRIAAVESRYPAQEDFVTKFRLTLKTVPATDGIGFTLPDDDAD